jgi:hypothetical protein
MHEPRATEAPSSDEFERLVIEAELCLAEIDRLLAEVEAQAETVASGAGRMCWRSETARRFDERLVLLRDRIAAAAAAVAEVRHQLEQQLRRLRVLADAAKGTLWATN